MNVRRWAVLAVVGLAMLTQVGCNGMRVGGGLGVGTGGWGGNVGVSTDILETPSPAPDGNIEAELSPVDQGTN